MLGGITFRLQMSSKTISEIEFERFCEDREIRFKKIKEQDKKTPDYEIYLNDQIIIAEVKQTDPNYIDKEVLKTLRKKKVASYWEESGRRVRLKIDSAKKQLKEYSKGKYPTILIVFDNVSIKPLDAIDFMTAMYGAESAKIDRNLNGIIEIVDVGFGGKKKFTSNTNTSISAIGWLYYYPKEVLNLSVYHNVYAKNPLDPNLMKCKNIKHYTVDPKNRGRFQHWKEL